MLIWTRFCHIDLESFTLDFKIHRTNPAERKKEEEDPQRRKRSIAKKKTHGTHKSSLHQAHTDRRSTVQFPISMGEIHDLQTTVRSRSLLLLLFFFFSMDLFIFLHGKYPLELKSQFHVEFLSTSLSQKSRTQVLKTRFAICQRYISPLVQAQA